MSDRFVDQLLPVLYQSAEQPENWNHALGRICEELQLCGAIVQMLNRQGNRYVQQWVVRDPVSTANAELHDSLINNDDNPRLEISSNEHWEDETSIVCDEDLPEYRYPRFSAFRERLKAVGHGRSVLLNIQYPGDRCLSLILNRHYNDCRTFDQELAAFLRTITPHLKQTVSLSEKLSQSQRQIQLLSHSINQLDTGLVILDGNDDINWVNDTAMQVLARSPHLSVVGSLLRCGSREGQAKLNEMLQSVYSGANQQVVGVLGQHLNGSLHLLARPVFTMQPESCSIPYVALYLSDGEGACNMTADDLVSLFGLSPAEATLSVALCEGLSLSDYACKQGIAEGTARIQLKSTFTKLGVNRQPDLIRLISSSITAKVCLPK